MCDLSLRSQPVGRHREAQLLPKVGGGAAAGNSLAADLHQCGAAQPHNSAVSVFSGRAAGRRARVHGKARVCVSSQAPFSLTAQRQRGD